MKKLLSIGLLLAICATYTSCKFPESNDANNIRMQDSIFATLPLVNGLKIEVKGNKDVVIVIYSKKLFNSAEDKRQATVEELTRMTVAIYEENNWLSTGKVFFVANNSKVSDVSSVPNKEYDMDIKTTTEKRINR